MASLLLQNAELLLRAAIRKKQKDVKIFQNNFLESIRSPFKSKSLALIFSNESEYIVLTKEYLISFLYFNMNLDSLCHFYMPLTLVPYKKAC